MSIYSMYKTSKEKENDGIWVSFGLNSKNKETRVKLARATRTNAKYSKALERLTKPHKRQKELGTLSPEIENEIVLKAFAEAIVLDWENMEDENLKDMKYTKENVIKVLQDLPDFFNDLVDLTTKADIFKEEELQENAKN